MLESPNGYQAYFVLQKPSYISSANNYKSLRANKAIARSLKLAFSKEVPGVDFGCNPFGIFRFPTEENILSFDPGMLHDFSALMSWSKKVAADNREFTLTIQLPGKRFDSEQVKMQWFKDLLSIRELKGGKGLLGRNSAVFTASLACYSSDMDKEECLDLMDEFNSYLNAPISHNELKKIIKSAYSGKYQGAAKEYVNLLHEQWGIEKAVSTQNASTNPQNWYKFAKSREERQKSHYSEWKKDIVNYINNRTTVEQPYIKVTRKELMAALNIPESSLKDLLRQLKKSADIFIETKLGRNGYTRLATSKSIALALVSKRQQCYRKYLEQLLNLFPTQQKQLKLVVRISGEKIKGIKQESIWGDSS